MSRSSAAPVPFSATDWLLLLAVAAMWGSSFLLIKIGVAEFPPATVAWFRVLFGALVIGLVPAARKPLRARRDWWPVGVLGLVWMAVPFTLFAAAEQTIPSALAGMINGGTPLFTAAIALIWFRRRPPRRLALGLAVGFLGVVAIGVPSIEGRVGAAAVGLVLLATLCYGTAFNLTERLQSRSGALPVIWRAELVALAALSPAGVLGLGNANPTAGGMLAMVALGALSTGVAFALFSVLVGRVGAARASVTTYLMPVVAIVLGVGLASEEVAPVALVGIVLVLLGAWLAASVRRPRPRTQGTESA